MSELLNKVQEHLDSRCSGAVLAASMERDFPLFHIEKKDILSVLGSLKEEMGFTFLTTMCGIHYPEQGEMEFAIMYQLHCLQRNERIRLKIFMSKNQMDVPTVTGLFATANWMEREAFDFYGFKFNGHPDLRRILNMDEMNYHPMRKEYALEDSGRDDKQDKYFGR
jgi:NADH-quinone oxidoreductase subunit C